MTVFSVIVDGNTILQRIVWPMPCRPRSGVRTTAGVELARHVDLGLSGPGSYYTDCAYDLGADAIFNNLAHSIVRDDPFLIGRLASSD